MGFTISVDSATTLMILRYAMISKHARMLHVHADIQTPACIDIIMKAQDNAEFSFLLGQDARYPNLHCLKVFLALHTDCACCFEYADATSSGNRRNLSASWNAFSCGPHNCIGQALALAETRTALAVLLANFQFDLPDGFSRHQYLKREQVWRITLQPKHELPLVVTSIADCL